MPVRPSGRLEAKRVFFPIQALARFAFERIRCTQHNILDLRTFSIRYRHRVWRCSDGLCSFVVPYYPYVAVGQIEAYLDEGRLRPQPGMTVLDVGGCFGEFSLFASRCVGPDGRVIMIEPDPANAAAAKALLRLNGDPPNIQIFRGGLWSHPGRILFAGGQGTGGAILRDLKGGAASSGEGIEISVHSLASLMEELHLRTVHLVKIDAEGAEIEILKGAKDLPPSTKPFYAVASYHIVDGKRTADLLPEMFADMGYECHAGFPLHLTTWAWPRHSLPFISRAGDRPDPVS